MSSVADVVARHPNAAWVVWGLAREAGFWTVAYVCAVTLDKPLIDRLLPRLSLSAANVANAPAPSVDAGDAEREAAQRRARALVAATFVGVYAAALWGGSGSSVAKLLDPVESAVTRSGGGGVAHHRGRVR